MKKISNDDTFENYIGKFIDVNVNGTIKKYFVSSIDSGSITTGAGILYKPYNIINESVQQYCCSSLSAYVFFVCNSNGFKDDDFEIYLNGTSIGSAILGSDDYIGSMFFATPSSQNVISFVESPFVCPVAKMVPYYFNADLFQTGSNTLSMINRVQHFNANAGSIVLSLFHICSGAEESSVLNSETIESFSYVGDDGASFNFTFNL